MENKPLKRSKYMIALSHDHHAGLLFCWKIKEGLKKNIDLSRIKKYINFFWEDHLKQHFREEETLLFSRLNDKFTGRAMEEHIVLTELINRLSADEKANDADYLSFAELMVRHIRFEERVLFPHLEASLSIDTLVSIGGYLEKQLPFKDNYPDEFWRSAKVNRKNVNETA